MGSTVDGRQDRAGLCDSTFSCLNHYEDEGRSLLTNTIINKNTVHKF
jgi:hypothetical protein